MLSTIPYTSLVAAALIHLIFAAPTALHPTSVIAPRSTSPGYGTLTLTTTGPIVHAVINNPPINLWDYKLAHDFSTFLSSLAASDSISQNSISQNTTTTPPKVVTISSSNPTYWISHYDIHAISTANPVPSPGNATLIGTQLLHSRSLLSSLPTIFIAEINGHASGAGNELAVQCDIRYAGPGTLLSQLEVSLGLLPGAGGLPYLVKLIGRARALEYMLSARGVDAPTAERVGWVNRAFASEGELREEVGALASRIAAFPVQGLAAVKKRVNVQAPSEEELRGDNELFVTVTGTDVAQRAVERYLVLSEDQSGNAFEEGIPGDVLEIQG